MVVPPTVAQILAALKGGNGEVDLHRFVSVAMSPTGLILYCLPKNCGHLPAIQQRIEAVFGLEVTMNISVNNMDDCDITNDDYVAQPKLRKRDTTCTVS